MWTIKVTEEFTRWLNRESDHTYRVVRARLEKVKMTGHLGDFKHIEKSMFELRWQNGTRVYFSRQGVSEILVLLGGSKHGQQKDIQKAKKLLGI